MAVLGGCVLVACTLLIRQEVPRQLVTIVAGLGLCLLLFTTLTVQVDGRAVRCAFGLGVIRREILLRDVIRASVVRNHWIYGWGLRWIPGGWLWNVSGLDAVELELTSGKVFRIGTDEPTLLHAAIVGALRR